MFSLQALRLLFSNILFFSYLCHTELCYVCLYFIPSYSYFIYISELANRPQKEIAVVHIINIDVQDNHEEATIGAFLICEMATMVRNFYVFVNSIKTFLC